MLRDLSICQLCEYFARCLQQPWLHYPHPTWYDVALLYPRLMSCCRSVVCARRLHGMCVMFVNTFLCTSHLIGSVDDIVVLRYACGSGVWCQLAVLSDLAIPS